MATTDRGNRAASQLDGLVVVAFESRRAQELAETIRRYGGTPLSAPAMREIPTHQTATLEAYVRALQAGDIDIVLLLTGAGVRALVKQLEGHLSREELAAALKRAILVARGPKPVAALRELGLEPTWLVPSPHTWRELLALLDEKVRVAGKTVAVQEYGAPNPDLLMGLEARGARVRRVELYRWDYPENLEPLFAGVRAILNGSASVVIFTSANQVHNVWAFVEREFDSQLDQWALRLRQAVVASVGPVCSAALREYGAEPDLEAVPPKMGVLLHLLSQHAHSLLAQKRT